MISLARPVDAVFEPTPHADEHWWSAVALLAVLAMLTTAAMLTDNRTLDGQSLWLKPLKFQLSLIIHFATLALIARLLDEATRTGFLMQSLVLISLTAGLFEIVYITIQAAAGAHSHFNQSTAFHQHMYTLMGIMAVLLIVVPAVLGVLIAIQPNIAPALRWSITIGMIAGFAATFVVAGYLGGNGSHFVGVHPPHGATVPLFGWSMVTGDLRPAHFLALHIMQNVPLTGWLLTRWHPNAPVWPVVVVTAMLLASTALIFAQALRGLPLTSWRFF